MPEGVEVRVITDQLRREFLGSVLKDASVLSGRYNRHGQPPGLTPFLDGCPREVVGVDCKGKFMHLEFLHGWHMFCTLGMTGSWSPQQEKHARVKFDLTDGRSLFFVDPRNFGTLKFVSGREELDKKLRDLGWDPLRTPPPTVLPQLILSEKRTIAEVLMDQGVFAGVGNYIKAETLHMARLSPWRVGNTLSLQEVDNLIRSVQTVMSDSLRCGGTTIRDYRDLVGKSGTYQTQFKVYGKTEDPEGNVVIREKTRDSRTTHWVPNVQV